MGVKFKDFYIGEPYMNFWYDTTKYSNFKMQIADFYQIVQYYCISKNI